MQRFINNNDGTITDTETGLVWQKDHTDPITWQKALDYTKSLNLAGYTDWRLPTETELSTLTDYGTCSPLIEFPETFDEWFWSLCSYTLNSGYAWYASFNGKDVHYGGRNIGLNSVRCVRGKMKSTKFRVIVAGSRGFNDFTLMCQKLDKLLSNKESVEIISGTCRGADQLGERYAESRGYSIDRYPANWDKYGKSAGFRRNEQMAVNADALVAFWDKESKGTKHMIDLARKHNLQFRIIGY